MCTACKLYISYTTVHKVQFICQFSIMGGGVVAWWGGGGNFHYKGIYRRAAGIGHTFQAIQYMNGHHFHFKSIINLVSFLLKKYMNR